MTGFVASLCSTCTAPAQAEPADRSPILSTNQNPFVQIFGLPPAEGGSLISPRELELRMSASAANSSAVHSEASETIVIDGETYRLQLGMRYGLNERFELGLDLAYVRHTGGFMDKLIDEWHDLTGLPDGERPSQTRDRLEYSYARSGRPVYLLNDSSSGLGDIRLSVALALAGRESDAGRSLALRTSLKLPTGESDSLHGSGATDVAVGVAYSDFEALSAVNLNLRASGGVLWLGDGDVLPGLQQNLVPFGSLGLSWHRWESLAIKAQFDAHGAFYDSGLEEIGDASVQLAFGGSWAFAPSWIWEITVVEDIVVDSSPDVVFQSSWRSRF